MDEFRGENENINDDEVSKRLRLEDGRASLLDKQEEQQDDSERKNDLKKVNAEISAMKQKMLKERRSMEEKIRKDDVLDMASDRQVEKSWEAAGADVESASLAQQGRITEDKEEKDDNVMEKDALALARKG